MMRYLTASEIADLIRRPIGTVYRWASEYGWRRSDDNRRPVLYLAEDVETTLEATRQPTQLDTPACGEEYAT